MEIDAILNECRHRMDKTVEYLTRELRGIRTGRANTALIEYVKVDYYGNSTDLRELAVVSVPEPTQLLIKPFDPSAKQEIIRAIESADLGLNPMSEGSAIRVNVPSPSADRRKQLVLQVRKVCEDAKVAIRNERRDANKLIDQRAADKAKPVPEDTVKSAKTEVDQFTKKHTDAIDDLSTRKVREVEEI